MRFESAKDLAAAWRFHLVGLPRLVDEVTRLLSESTESPSLLKLVIGDDLRREEVSDLLARALQETGVEPLTDPEAGRTAARSVASGILHGDVTPERGASLIWWRIASVVEELFAELSPFVTLASDRDEVGLDADKGRELDEGIVEAARAYLSRDDDS